jgi:hypothetical protein
MKKDKRTIFTVITWNNEPYRKRIVGWWLDEQSARQCILSNWGDIYEDGHYEFTILEEVNDGLYPETGLEEWYKWNKREKKYKPCKKPPVLKCIVNWGIG